MDDTIGIAVTGASGRMGQMLIRTITETDGVHLAAAIERTGHDWVGQDVGQAMGGAASGVVVTDDAAQAIATADVVIDFTAPEATLAFSAICADAGVAHVIGTTGMTDAQIAELQPASKRTTTTRSTRHPAPR